MAEAAAGISAGVAVLGFLSGRKQARSVRQQNNEYYIQQIQQQNAANDAARAHAEAQIHVAHQNAAIQGAYANQLRAIAHETAGTADDTRAVADEIREAALEAEQLAVQNAGNIRAEGREDVRRTSLEHNQVEGMIKARQAASGVKTEHGSVKQFYDSHVKANNLVTQWMRRAFQSRAKLEEERGAYEKMLGMIQADQVDVQADQIEINALQYLAQADHTEAMAHLGIMEAHAGLAGIPENQRLPSPTNRNNTGGGSRSGGGDDGTGRSGGGAR